MKDSSESKKPKNIVLVIVKQVLRVIALVSFLIVSNPSYHDDSKNSSIYKHISNTSKNYFSAVRKLWSSSFFSYFNGENSTANFILFSVRKSGKHGYYTGIGGFWIENEYWNTIPAWFLIFNILYHISNSNSRKVLRISWMQNIFTVMFYCLMTHGLEVHGSGKNEVKIGFFYLIVLTLMHLLYDSPAIPFRPFPKHCNPAGWLYGIGSAAAVLLANFADQFVYLGAHVKYSQIAAVLVMLQILIGHRMGFIGSMSGLVVSILAKYTSIK